MSSPFEAGTRQLTGRYALLPNPCTTRPCLPGMAWAVQTGETALFLTVGGQWSDEERSWGGYTPRPGERISVHGEVARRLDVDGQAFYVIEARALRPAS